MVTQARHMVIAMVSGIICVAIVVGAAICIDYLITPHGAPAVCPIVVVDANGMHYPARWDPPHLTITCPDLHTDRVLLCRIEFSNITRSLPTPPEEPAR